MPEILLHYIWQRELFRSFPQYTTDGRHIDVLSVGVHNTDAGPDFSDVHLRATDSNGKSIDWVGNIAIHVRASDWFKHRHHLDKAYDSVILHVVRDADKQVFTVDSHDQQNRQYETGELQPPLFLDQSCQ